MASRTPILGVLHANITPELQKDLYGTSQPGFSAIFVFLSKNLNSAIASFIISDASPKAWDARVYFILAIISTPLILTLHPASALRKSLYYLPLLLLACAFRSPVGPHDGAYQFGILLASWSMRIIDRLYLHDPEETFMYSNEPGSCANGAGDRKARDVKLLQDPRSLLPIQKLAWATELMIVTRGVGWNWQIRQIPSMNPKVRASRTAFLWSKAHEALKKIAILYLIKMASKTLLELAEQQQQQQYISSVMEVLSKFSFILLHPVFLHVFMYASWGHVVYSSLDLAENILALIFVGFRWTERWSRPEMWPPIFGQFRDSYSIRRGWGVFWHQNMRRVCQSPADFIISKIPPLVKPQTRTATLVRRYARLLLVFVFSGIIHAGGSIYMAQRGFSLHTTDGGNVSGFAYQGLSLILEDSVLSLLGIDDHAREREGTQTMLRRLVGYCIVHGYAAYATPALKVIPLALDHGLEAAGGPLMVGVKMVGMGAGGVLKNPFATMIGSFNV